MRGRYLHGVPVRRSGSPPPPARARPARLPLL